MKRFGHLFSLLLGVAVCTATVVQAQMPAVPIDSKVRYGKLSNGLTYYIRHNEEPAGQAEFFIAQKVGSVLEEDSQRGLAHFLEHMAFNGMTRLPGKTMSNYLETIGVKFGANLNAYTGFDETVYNMSNVPVSREGIVDTCLLVLHEWSAGIALDPEEIDKERGVIHEEWRSGQGATMRMYETLLPDIFPDSRYGHRMPIGLMDVVDHFKPDELRAYYKKWYRPDLQAVIIVGDIDAAQIEQKLTALFADIPAPVNPAFREYFPVPDNDEPIVSLASDAEATTASILLFYKHDGLPEELKPTQAALVANYIKNVASTMVHDRLQELLQQPQPPFMGAYVYDDDFFVTKTKEAFTGYAAVRETEVKSGLATLVREIERVKRFGFTASEYARAQSNFLSYLENRYNERDKQKSGTYASEYVRHFEDGDVIPGIEYEYEFYKAVVNMIPVDAVNQTVAGWVGDKNMVIAVMGPKKDGLTYPSKAELLDVVTAVKAEDIEPYAETVTNEPLLSDVPKAGKVVGESVDKRFGTVAWKLSNGARVFIKQTDFQDDEIQFYAISPGGTSLYDVGEAVNLKLLNMVVPEGGLGAFSKTDLQKVLAGKQAWVNARVDNNNEGLSGYCPPKDLETMMQLVYLNVTAPRTDTVAFQSLMSRLKSQLENRDANPYAVFNDTLVSTLYRNHPLTTQFTAEILKEANYSRIMEIYKDRFKDVGDFIFTFVGNIDLAVLKPLVEQYIASLPSAGRKEAARDDKVYIRKGDVKNYFDKDMTIPKITVYSLRSGDMAYVPKNLLKMNVLTQILDIVYTETIREEDGGTYGVGVAGEVRSYPNAHYKMQISFETNADQRDKLIAKAHEGLQSIAQHGPSKENLNKVKEYMLKTYKEQLRDNGIWRNFIYLYHFYGIDLLTGYEKMLSGLTPADIQKFAAKIVAQNNHIEIVMNGVEKQAE
ncbi:MAG: insulinase family protein [Prevotellaceae bacterium]|jgi:zinc protease|nr:insulinase family protein [Prevotellaceae bacterium]